MKYREIVKGDIEKVLYVIMNITVIACGVLTVFIMILMISKELNNTEEEQSFTPITYHVIECNVAGFPNQYDYVIEISTRDPEEVGRIIRLLEGVE